MYKFETHIHTSNCSACAVSNGYEMVDAAKEKGYSGFVVTNHFYHGNTCVDRNLAWEDFINSYRNDYEIMREYGETCGIKVFFGFEEGFAPGKEMLVYGITPNILIKNPEFIMMGVKEKVDFIHKKGGIVICAHPYRNRFYIPDPDKSPDPTLFDGIEVYNFFNTNEENQKALSFAESNNLLKTSGGDVHNARDFGNAGISFKTEIKSYKDFLINLKKGNYSLIIPK